MGILDLLKLGEPEETTEAADAGDTETVRKIVDALEELPEERARFVAAFAYLLGRVAHADLEISGEETREMERLVVDRGGLPEEQALIVVQMAKTQNRLFGGTENYLVAREFNDLASREEKLGLLDCLYAVSASDESISSVEDAEIRRVADELRLEHKEYIGIRSKYRDHLEVLKD